MILAQAEQTVTSPVIEALARFAGLACKQCLYASGYRLLFKVQAKLNSIAVRLAGRRLIPRLKHGSKNKGFKI